MMQILTATANINCNEYFTESLQEEVELKEEALETNVANQTTYKMEGI